MAGEFKVGDVVQLKSGGELMTVVEVDDKYGATVTWQSGGKRRDTTYPPGALVLYKEPSQSDLEPE